ncbi:kinase-like protein [Mycena pura]|uniref:non-specific serine/threonine protein kinase n=1 Tax=Mycena pura TaxID=153505 RepID=A0AAD6UJL2_9AGAR|nr:kinase-like protein [Mycena pura]
MLLSFRHVALRPQRLPKLRLLMALHSSALAPLEEPMDQYRPGGYHPMKPGELVNKRYEVMRKLGWGEYSTVWLVKFQPSETYAALKVMKAEVSDIPELNDADYLRRILSADPTDPGFRHNLHLLDEFRIDGPNGRHLCLVTELLGERLDQYAKRFPLKRVPIKSVKHITRQVILAVSYLHDKCNIIHTDIKTNNILFTLPDAAILPVTPTIPAAVESVANDTVKLIDLGVACWADRVEEHWTDLIQSPELRAPEVAVGAGWGKPADVWSLGCLVYELAMGQFLITSGVGEKSIPYLHAVYFGPYPHHLTQDGKYSHMFFKEDGSQRFPQSDCYPLADIIRKHRLPGDSDTEGLIQFLGLMLCLDPGERATLQMLLEHPWLASD